MGYLNGHNHLESNINIIKNLYKLTPSQAKILVKASEASKAAKAKAAKAKAAKASRAAAAAKTAKAAKAAKAARTFKGDVNQYLMFPNKSSRHHGQNTRRYSL